MYYSTIIYINYLPPVMGMINTIRPQGKEEKHMTSTIECGCGCGERVEVFQSTFKDTTVSVAACAQAKSWGLVSLVYPKSTVLARMIEEVRA